jgi:hypothetical protein
LLGRKYKVLPALNRVLVHHDEHVAGGFGRKAGGLGATSQAPRGVARRAGPTAHVANPQDAPRLAVHGDDNVGRRQTGDHLPVPIESDDLDRNGRGLLRACEARAQERRNQRRTRRHSPHHRRVYYLTFTITLPTRSAS